MSGLYGTIRGAKIEPKRDAEIFYFYRPNRSTTDEDFTQFKSLSSSNLVPSTTEVNNGVETCSRVCSTSDFLLTCLMILGFIPFISARRSASPTSRM